MKKFKATQEQIRANLEFLSNTELTKKEDDFYIIQLNTPIGKKIIKSPVPLEQWLKENQLTKKNKR
jgi:hypothetical protein